jgi:ABC-type transport system involved in multi-copper enzyme maturation permease subunit
MRTLVGAELRKLTSLRSTWAWLAFTVLLSPGIAALALGTATHLRDGLTRVGLYAFGLSGVAAGMFCAVAFASEYQDRTIVTTFTLVPARARIVLAKATAAFVVGTGVGVMTIVASYGLAAIWLSSSGVAWPWSAGTLLQSAAGVLVIGTTTAVGGVGIGGLTQNPPVAGAVMGLVWFGISNLLSSFVGFFHDYGIPAAATALTQPTGQHHYGFAGALAVMLALAGLLLLAGLRRVQLADIN